MDLIPQSPLTRFSRCYARRISGQKKRHSMNSLDSSIFERLIIPVLSFFKEEGRIDFKATLQYIAFLNRIPIRKIILFGTTGEGVSLGIAEKIELLRVYEEHLSQHTRIT